MIGLLSEYFWEVLSTGDVDLHLARDREESRYYTPSAISVSIVHGTLCYISMTCYTQLRISLAHKCIVTQDDGK